MLEIRVCGDGVVAIKSDTGLHMWRMDWINNMPCYPAYEDDDFSAFIAAHDSHERVFQMERWIGDGSSFCQESYLTRDLNQNLLRFGHHISTAERFSAVGVFSDGVTQVEGMPWQEVVVDLMNFRSTAGDFVKRRMNKFLKDHRPVDDIAMAAILVDHEG